MSTRTFKIRKLLLPFSWLYGLVVGIRNWMYDVKIFKQYKFDIPVICVGNLTVGGTGKTPHIEYLTQMLQSNYKVGILSRGYKRKSKGFKIVSINSTPQDVGDEPLQIKQKYPEAFVFVDRDRKNGIEQIMNLPDAERPDVILLDDGFQHRRVLPSLSILLVDSNRPIHEDKLLPAGNLREHTKGRHRASIVIVTKCNRDMSPLDFRISEANLDLFPFQKVYHTTFDYSALQPVFSETPTGTIDIDSLKDKHILLVTGIATPKPLVDYLSARSASVVTINYPDHYQFKGDDIADIQKKYGSINIDDDHKIIITTEKDATRFREMDGIDPSIKNKLYYIPIEVSFLKNKDKESFNKKIFKHVRNYQTNG